MSSIGPHLLAWPIGAGEIYLAATFVGSPVTVVEAVVLESLVGIVRAAAFLIPGALGVQEGGFILLGALFGLTPDNALAISLIRRACELALGIPGHHLPQLISNCLSVVIRPLGEFVRACFGFGDFLALAQQAFRRA